MILTINSDNPQQRLINKACEALEEGGLIAYPTDTLYAIGCDLFNKKGMQQLYKLKKSPLKQPFSIICDNLKEISRYAQVSNYAYKTMKRLLPGPYTFILEGTKLVPKLMLTRRKTIGIRIPGNMICQAMVKTLGHPVISTSALLDDPHLIFETYKPYLRIVIDGGVSYPDPSSVISLIGDKPEVIREGKGDVTDFL